MGDWTSKREVGATGSAFALGSASTLDRNDLDRVRAMAGDIIDCIAALRSERWKTKTLRDLLRDGLDLQDTDPRRSVERFHRWAERVREVLGFDHVDGTATAAPLQVTLWRSGGSGGYVALKTFSMEPHTNPAGVAAKGGGRIGGLALNHPEFRGLDVQAVHVDEHGVHVYTTAAGGSGDRTR